MILFLDTSALIKRYIEESGSKNVDKLMDTASEIIVSKITKIETISTIRRLLLEKLIDKNKYKKLKEEILYDFKYYNVLNISENIESLSITLIDKYQLKTLDAIQLATCCSVKKRINSFLVSDQKLIDAAKSEKIDTINPVEIIL